MQYLLLLAMAVIAEPAPLPEEVSAPVEAQVRLAGEVISLPQPARKEDGLLVGAVAPCARALGAREIEFDAQSKCLRIMGANGVELMLVAGSATLVVNGTPQPLARRCELEAGRMVGPLRPCLEALGASVVWLPDKLELQAEPTVRDVVVRGGPSGVKVEIRASSPVSFKRGELKDPPRVFVDIPHARLERRHRGTTYVNVAKVARVRWAQFSDDPPTVRVVIDLIAPQPVKLDIARTNQQAALLVGALRGDEPIIERPRPRLLALRGSADEAGTTRVAFEFSDPVLYDYEVKRQPLRIVFEIPDAEADLERTVVPLESPFVARLSAQGEGNNLEIVLDMRQLIGFQLEQTERPSRIALVFSRGRLQDRLVVIDPGHGGQDPGAQGTRVQEKEATLAVGERVCELLEEEGVYAISTRNEDRFVGLFERPALANRLKADLFVSIHCNSEGRRGPVQGTETWYYTERSKCLAAIMQMCLTEGLGRPDRGVKRARFVVVREAEMPAVLVELAFLSNDEEESLLAQRAFRERAARSIVAGIRCYVEGTDSRHLVESELGG